MATNRISFVVLLIAFTTVATVEAQPLGSLTWQLQPYCNRLTAAVTQQGTIYTLDGYDDQCGGARAPLVGVATLNPDGTIAFGVHITAVPGGRPVSVEARIAVATLSGPWTDSVGGAGTLVLGGAAAGAPRLLSTSSLAWGSAMVAPTPQTEPGLVLRPVVSTPRLTPVGTNGLTVESVPASGERSTPSSGVVSNIAVGTAVTAVSAEGNGVVAQGTVSPGASDGTFGIFARGELASLGVRASAEGSTPAVHARGSRFGLGAIAPASALELRDGGIVMSGSATPGFVHVATSGSIVGTRTSVSHPLLNGRPDAVLAVTYLRDSAIGDLPGGVGVFYDSTTARWNIIRNDGIVMPPNARFHVVVFNVAP